MRFDLPTDTRDFTTGLRKLADSLVEHGADTDEVSAALADVGFFELLRDDGPDPENRHVNAVAALEQLARAALVGPFASTVWANAREPVAELVGTPAPVFDQTDRLVLHGERVRQVVTSGGLVPIGPTRAAVVKIERGHVWSSAPGAGLEEVDPGFAWRAAAAETLGHMEAGLSRAVEHAKARVQFKRPISAFQAVQFRLAECRWRLSGLQLLVHEAAWRADRADPHAAEISALAWLHARSVGRIVTGHVHQVFGASGFTDEMGLIVHTGATTVLRAVVSAGTAVDAVRAGRGPVGPVPPSTTLAGFTRSR